MDNLLSQLVEILHRQQCSCVISSHGEITLCHERGVWDLFRILKANPQLLSGASLADKVIGKGAAALIILGKVKEVYADVISQHALDLLNSAAIPVCFGKCVPCIINRAGTGICPVEMLCKDAVTAEECLPLISGFINKMKTNQKENHPDK